MSSSSTASASSSSLSTPSDSDGARAWAVTTFTFPPCSSHMRRSPPKPTQRPKSREPRPSSQTTSRVINGLPGFDDFAQLVISSERCVPRVTVTPSTDMRRSRRTHATQRSTPSEPKQAAPILPVPTASLPWSKEENEAGRVTFIFGRLRPAVARYTPSTASPSTPSETSTGTRIDFVRRTSSQTVTGEQTPQVQQHT